MLTLTYDIERAKKAVELLVKTPFGKHHMRRIRTYSVRPRAMPFKGQVEVLNELLVIGRQDLQAMENLLALVDFKRDDRVDYQRAYMAQRRARERKVIRIEEFLVEKPLSLEERREVLLKQSAVWKAERAKYIEDADRAHVKAMNRPATWLEKTGFICAFWAIRDRELDLLNEEAVKQRAVVHRKREVRVDPPRPKHNPMLHDALMQMRKNGNGK